jgi:hypothetical protein
MTTPTYSRRAGRLLTLDRGVKHSESWRDQQPESLDAGAGIVLGCALGLVLWIVAAVLLYVALGLV